MRWSHYIKHLMESYCLLTAFLIPNLSGKVYFVHVFGLTCVITNNLRLVNTINLGFLNGLFTVELRYLTSCQVRGFGSGADFNSICWTFGLAYGLFTELTLSAASLFLFPEFSLI